MPGETHISTLHEIVSTLEEVIVRLESVDALVAAAHVQAGVDAIRSMVDEPHHEPCGRDE